MSICSMSICQFVTICQYAIICQYVNMPECQYAISQIYTLRSVRTVQAITIYIYTGSDYQHMATMFYSSLPSFIERHMYVICIYIYIYVYICIRIIYWPVVRNTHLPHMETYQAYRLRLLNIFSKETHALGLIVCFNLHFNKKWLRELWAFGHINRVKYASPAF